MTVQQDFQQIIRFDFSIVQVQRFGYRFLDKCCSWEQPLNKMGWVFSNQALCTGIPSSRHDLPSPAYIKCNIGTHHLQERPCSYFFSARASSMDHSEILKTPSH